MHILYESPHILVVNKPAGLLVEHSPHYPSVEDWANEYTRTQPGKNYIGIVHRLDRAVSGALLLARRKSALKVLNEQFARREVRKIYWAVVDAAPPSGRGRLQHWLYKDQKEKRANIYSERHAGAVEVSLDYRVLSRKEYTWLLEIDLHTGKFHQIRAQLAAVGCPIRGDIRYGSTIDCGPDHIALHARFLAFADPQTGLRVEVNAPAPDDRCWEGIQPLICNDDKNIL